MIKSFIWLAFDKLFKSLGGFILNLQIITFLSLSDYGILSYSLAINLFITAILVFFREILVKEFSLREKNIEVSSLLMGITSFRIICSVIGGIIAFYFVSSQPVVLVIYSALLNFSDLPEAYWQSRGKMYKPVLIRTVVFFVFAGLKIFVMTHPTLRSLETFTLLVLFESIAYTVCSYLFVVKEVRLFDFRISKAYVWTKGLLIISIPLLLNNLFTVGYMRIDQLIIKTILGNKELGVYSFTLNVAEMLQAVPFMLGIAIAPMVFQSDNNIQLMRSLEKMMTFMLVFGVFCLAVLIIFFPYLQVTYKLPNAYGVMIIVAVGTYPTFISYLASKYLLHTGQINHFLKRSFIASLFSLLLNYFFVEKFGLYASAIIYALSQWFIGFFSNYFLPDKLLFSSQCRSFLNLFKINTYKNFMLESINIFHVTFNKI